MGATVFYADPLEESIFDKYLPNANAQLPEANAQLPTALAQEMNDTVRGATTEDTMISETRHITTMGLPEHIPNSDGVYVAEILSEDSNGVQIESGFGSIYFDKSTCAMSQFNNGRIFSSSQPEIKGNMWIVKQALNGTDNWSDVSQNSLPCTVTTTVSGDLITINSTKSDVNGTIIEIYEYAKYKGIKQTVYFTNNDPSLTNEKFSFSNILLGTPKSFRTAYVTQVNGTDVVNSTAYSIYPLDNQPISLGGGNATVIIDPSSIGTIVEYERDDFLSNGTEVIQGFTWHLNNDKIIHYTFDTAQTELWKLKFEAKSNSDLDVYIDYANVIETLPVGSTTSIDPTTIISSFSLLTVKSFPVFANGGTCGQGFGTAIFTGLAQGQAGGAGGVFGCEHPILKFDITAIPDDAVPISGTFTMEILTQGGTGVHQRAGFFRAILNEDMFGLPANIVAPAVIGGTEMSVDEHFLLAGIGGTTINGASCSATFPCFMTDTQTALLSDFIIEFELLLESGKNFYQLAWCMTGSGVSCGNVTTNGSFVGATYTFDPAGTFFSVEWEQFAPPDAPTNVVAFYSPAPDTCSIDWEAPSNTGGRPLLGYQILRSTGGAFQVIVADTGSPLPTDFDDTTIIGGVANTYQIAGITLEGVGTASIQSNGCGVPELSNSPILTNLLNLGLNLVSLDWLAPTFDGNDIIVGYKIERTIGTAEIISTPDIDRWEFNSVGEHPSAGCGGMGWSQDTNNAILSYTEGGTTRCTMTTFKTFDKTLIQGRDLSVKMSMNVGCTVSCGAFHSKVWILDGAYSIHDATESKFSQALYPNNSPQLNTGGAGNGALYGASSSINANGLAEPLIDSMDFSASAPTNPSISPDGKVTIMFIYTDVACCSAGGGGHGGSFDWIDIEGLERWDFGTITNSSSVVNETVTEGCGNQCWDLFADFLLGDGFVTLVEDTGSASLEHIDNTVSQNTLYGYRVSAINSIGISDPSNILSITTAGLPETPDAPTVTPTGTQTIDITWTEPELNSGTILNYLVERKVGLGGVFTTLAVQTDREINDGVGLFPLQTATTYCYRVSITTNIGASDPLFSDETCGTTFDAPSEPTNLLVVALDGSSVNMQFDDPASDGGASIIGFKVEQKIGAGVFVTLDELTFVKTRNDTGLPVGTEITYRVSASNIFGFGDIAVASDTTDATPQVPPNFSCSATSQTSLTLNWDTPITFSAPTGYQIDRRSIGGGFSTIVADTASTQTFFLNDGLAVDALFEYRILGHTTEGDTDFTPIIRCTTLGTPDFPPEDLQGDFTTSIPHTMVLAWDIPDTFGVPITEFRIERNDGAGFNEIASVSPTSFLFIDTNPNNAITQSYRVFTVGSVGDSAPTIAVPFSANQTSHWHYENTIDDTGENKNAGTLTGNANFDNAGKFGLGHTFDGTTYITVDNESDYDHDTESFGITTYYKGLLGASAIPSSPTWQYMAHDFISSSEPNSEPNAITYTQEATNMRVNMNDQTGNRAGQSNFWKVFNATEIDGLTFQIEWQGVTNGDSRYQKNVRIYDGDYFTASIQQANGASQASCLSPTVCDFPDNTARTAKDSGLLQTGLTHTLNFGQTVENFVIDTSGSTNAQGLVTIFIEQNDTIAGVDVGGVDLHVYNVEIVTLDKWQFGSNLSLDTQQGAPSSTGEFGIVTTDTVAPPPNSAMLVTKANTATSTGIKLFIDQSGVMGVKLTNTDNTNEIEILGSTNLTDDLIHFIGFGYNGNQTASGVSLMVDGSFETKNVIVDNLSATILNNEPIVIGATSSGSDIISGLMDDTRFFGSGTLDDATLEAVGNNAINTVIPIQATLTLNGNTFSNISAETPVIIMTSGYPLPTVDQMDLFNFTATNVNSVSPAIVIDGVSGVFTLNDPSFFNVMSSLSNYTTTASISNSEETFPLLSNFDLQIPLFTFTGDFFFQQQRNNDFSILSFNYTQTDIPFDLACNFKSTIFENGTTVEFNDVFFVQHLQPVPQLEDVVVACIDQNSVIVDPTAPSFGGINTILSFVSFGDTTGVGNFLQFTNNYGDFFGVGLPFLFVIILAAAFTGRSAPTGILIIAIAIGIMWAMGILEVDPFMWGIIIVLVILGVLGGKKFL